MSRNNSRTKSRTLAQPLGQVKLTNVAVVRLKKHGNRFEIACFPNKVLSWRSGSEKDIGNVLQSHAVYSNVSKGAFAKDKDLVAAFGSNDQTKICLEILEKGQLQVAGKEREAELSNKFRDVGTNVMQRTINPETKLPYTITMIERLLHEVHFAVDLKSDSKPQALGVIPLLEANYPIKKAPMRLRIIVAKDNSASVLEKLDTWNADNVTKEEVRDQLSIAFELNPRLFGECNVLVRNLQGRLEILAVSVHAEGDTCVGPYDEHYEDVPPALSKESTESSVTQLSERLQNQAVSTTSKSSEGEVKQSKCNTCNALVGDAKQYREHFKGEWHRHNLKRKTRNLPPLTAEECLAEVGFDDGEQDRNEYSF